MAAENIDGAIGYDFIVQVKNGKLDEVKALVAEHPAVVNYAEDHGFSIGFTGLHHAAKQGYTEIAELLITEGADVKAVNSFGATPFHYACESGSFNIAKVMIAKGVDVRAPEESSHGDKTPLYLALGKAAGGNMDLIKLLIAEGADLEAVSTRDLETPLHRAAMSGYWEIAKFLITEHGADMKAENKRGKTPLEVGGGCDGFMEEWVPFAEAHK